MRRMRLHCALFSFLIPTATFVITSALQHTSSIIHRHVQRGNNRVPFTGWAQFSTNYPAHKEHHIVSNRAKPFDEVEDLSLSNKDTRKMGSSINNVSPFRVPPDIITGIKNMANIVSVVESHNIPLFSRTGDNKGKALCPFHDDHNPSLSVDANKQIYKCFSCGAGGDVFNFVREYRYLRDGGEKISFIKSVQIVAEEYTDGRFNHYFKDYNANKNEYTEEELAKIKASEHKKRRILLANAAAAEFYGECLITLPAAGLARRHLQSRGISPATARSHALGFAPDVYFDRSKKSKSKEHGHGSLVHRLRDLGFSVKEIIDAGLASVCRSKSKESRAQVKAGTEDAIGEKNVKSDVNSKTSTQPNQEDSENDYTTIMDRFRGRLVVPIFDDSGAFVLAFGGRHLEAPSQVSSTTMKKLNSSFKAVKYLNSPETDVFIKKRVLYDLHHATSQLTIRNNMNLKREGSELKEMNDVSDKSPPSIVIVEGYFDALTLYDVGVRGVTACMGTALSTEQLEVISNIPGMRGKGEIIICLDNDEAGINAVERLCASSLLLSFSEKNGIKFRVASLPDHLKDPAECIESFGGGIKAGKVFQTEILETAEQWSDWYTKRLLSHYDTNVTETGTVGSFSDVCDRLSDFLSTFSNAAERTRRAYILAEKLSDLLSPKSGSSSGLRIQLESDLLNMASRKANFRDAMSRRIEKVDGFSSSSAENKNTVAKLASGGGTSNEIEDHFKHGTGIDFKQKKHADTSDEGLKRQEHRQRLVKSVTNIRQKSRKVPDPSILPHFSGFRFENPTDAAWLGLTGKNGKKKNAMVIGENGYNVEQTRSGKSPRKSRGNRPAYTQRRSQKEKLVFFNSNEYLGFEGNPRSQGDIEKTIKEQTSLVIGVDSRKVLLAAEERLLRTLVQFASARVAMKAAVDANNISHTSGSSGDKIKLIECSSDDRDWLLNRLLDSPDDAPIPSQLQEVGTPKQIRHHLASRSNVPAGYFGTTSVESSHQYQPSMDREKDDSIPVRDDPFSVQEDLSHTEGSVHDYELTESEDIESFAESFIPEMSMNENLEDEKDVEKVGEVTPELLSNSKIASVATTESSDVTIGSLDHFFDVEDDGFGDNVNRDIYADLVVQETVATILRVSAIKRQTEAREKMVAAYEILLDREKNEIENINNNTTVQTENEDDDLRHDSMYATMNLGELRSLCTSLGQELKELTDTVVELEKSAGRMNSRLLAFSSSGSGGFSNSAGKQRELAKMMDDHLENLRNGVYQQHETPENGGDHFFSSSDHNDDDSVPIVHHNYGGEGDDSLNVARSDSLSGASFHSSEKQRELAEMLDDHLANLPSTAYRPEKPGDDGDYVFGTDYYSNEVNPLYGGRSEPKEYDDSETVSSTEEALSADHSFFEDDFPSIQ